MYSSWLGLRSCHRCDRQKARPEIIVEMCGKLAAYNPNAPQKRHKPLAGARHSTTFTARHARGAGASRAAGLPVPAFPASSPCAVTAAPRYAFRAKRHFSIQRGLGLKRMGGGEAARAGCPWGRARRRRRPAVGRRALKGGPGIGRPRRARRGAGRARDGGTGAHGGPACCSRQTHACRERLQAVAQ